MNDWPDARRTRAYRSPRRTQGAAATKQAILSAATQLFVERGYGKVTVADIAQAAETAVPTVYSSTGGKSSILAAIIDQAIHDPIVDSTLTTVGASQDAVEIICTIAHGTRVDNERYHDLIRVMVVAATIDDTATDTLVRSDQIYRESLAHATNRLSGLDALRPELDIDRGTDILWFYFGHHAWHLYVSERGWSWDEAEQWLVEQASHALLRPQGATAG
jgi:AcrR family transcriptional regulator